MGEPYLGEIRMVGFDFAPKNWAKCDGQLLSITEYSALYSLLGVAFGGDGRTTVGLPDIRGRVPMHVGTGGFNDLVQRGERYGFETIILQDSQMPEHTHQMNASNQLGQHNTIGRNGDRVLAEASAGLLAFGPSTDLTSLSPGTTTSAGGGQAHSNVQPSLVINYIIALSGVYPPRN